MANGAAERGKIAHLGLQYGKACLQLGPQLAPRYLDFGKLPPPQRIRVSPVPKLFAQMVWFLLSSCFLLGSCNVATDQAEGAYVTSPL